MKWSEQKPPITNITYHWMHPPPPREAKGATTNVPRVFV